MMKFNLFFSILMFLFGQLEAQEIIQDYFYEPDSIRIGKGPKDFFPFSEKGFTLVLPENRQNLLGTVVALEDYRLYCDDTLKYQSFYKALVNKGFAFLIVATEYRLTFTFPKNR